MTMTSRPVFAHPCVLGLFLAVFAVCCRSPAEQTWQRVVGIIDNGGTRIAPVVASDTVQVGVPFLITVTTFGSACDRPDGSAVSTSGLLADVSPYDLSPPSKRSASPYSVHRLDRWN